MRRVYVYIHYMKSQNTKPSYGDDTFTPAPALSLIPAQQALREFQVTFFE